MPDQGGVFELVIVDEGLDVVCEGLVVVRRIMGRIAVVARVNRPDRAGKGAGQDAGAVREEGGCGCCERDTH